MKRVLASLLCILMLLTAMPLVSAANVDTPAVDTAYKFGMIQGNVSDTTVYYLAGGMNGYYMATTSDINAAIDVYLEAADGGYHFYTVAADGAKTYINMVVSGTHVNGAYEAAPSTVYTYDAAAGTIIADVDGAYYWFGTRNDKTYTTVGPCNTEYAGFYCQFYTADGSGAPEQPDLPDEPNTVELSIADAIALGASFPHNTYSTNKYKVTGVISEVYNTQYGNMYITDDAGNKLTIYGTYDADGTNRYDAMTVKPVAGDTVTIYGSVGQYNGTAQIKNGWIIAHTPGEGGGDTPVNPEPDDDIVVTDDYTGYIDFTDKANRVSYSTEQQVWAQNGVTIINDKGASTSNVGDYGGEGYPARFYKSSTVKIEFGGMTKLLIDCSGLEAKYVNGWADSITDTNATAVVDGAAVIITFAQPVNTFVWETLSAQSRANAIYVWGEGGDIGGGDIGGGDTPVDPDPDVPVNPPVDPADSATITFDDASKRIEFDADHQIWTENGIIITNSKGASTSNVADYVKPARFYKGSDLIVAYPGMTAIQFACNTAAYATALADAIGGAFVDGKIVIVSLSGVDSYTVSLAGGQVRMDAITVYTNGEGGNVGGGDTPVVPPVTNDPAPDTELSIADAIALGLSKEHNVYTEGKYFTTGVITEVYNTTYGNMKIADEAGNILTVYGTWSADGETRYDALEVKPVAGDRITVYGIIGQYNGTPQMKNGWILEHFPGEGGGDTPVVPPSDDPAPDSALTIEEAIALGSSKEHNVYTEGKYYVTGVISEVYNDVYGNMYIIDAAGNKLTIYGTYNADGTVRYDALEVKPVAGDTVTIYGIIGQYNGTAQIKNGWITAHTPGEGGGDTPVDPTIPDDYAASITFDADKANRVEYSPEQQVWAQNGITIINDKAGSVSNVGDYTAPARFYKTSSVTIEYPGMTKILIDCKGLESKYINGWAESITDDNATASIEGQYVIITFAQAVDSFTWAELSAQSRAYNMYVWAQGGNTPVEPDGFIEVSNDEAAAGEQVQITVTVADNPGIISAKVKVYFDTTALQFVSAVAGNFSASGYSWSDFATVQEKGYVIINWCDAISPDSTADLLATLTFQVKEDTAEGFYDITVEFSCEDDIFNTAGDTVWFEAINGGVAVVVLPAYTPGDVNGDNRVNNRDLGQLQQYLNEYELTTFNALAADVTGDGRVNNRDLGILQQYLNEYDVELKYGKEK